MYDDQQSVMLGLLIHFRCLFLYTVRSTCLASSFSLFLYHGIVWTELQRVQHLTPVYGAATALHSVATSKRGTRKRVNAVNHAFL